MQPFISNSSYKKNFVDFSQGGVTHVERRPVLPVYQLPFKGNSSYQKTFEGCKP